MLTSSKYRSVRAFLFLFVFILVLTGCNKTTPAPIVTQTALPVDTLEAPTATPNPARLVLVGAGGTASSEVITFLTDFSSINSLVFEQVTALDAPSLSPETRVVIFLQPPPDLDALVSAAPQTQFIVTGAVDPAGRANLSAITTRLEDEAFMGGYLTTLIAYDWRSGGMIPNDTSLGTSYANAFENGGRFVCGQCTPYFSPFYYFPLIVEESSAADTAAWLVQVDALAAYFLRAVYVDPAAARSEVLDALDFQGYILVGKVGTPLQERFTALLGYDPLPALQQLLPQVLAGSGGITIGSQVKIISFTDDSIITPAKVGLFNQMAADLAAGLVSPLSVP